VEISYIFSTPVGKFGNSKLASKKIIANLRATKFVSMLFSDIPQVAYPK